jgi:hypothetical protein
MSSVNTLVSVAREAEAVWLVTTPAPKPDQNMREAKALLRVVAITRTQPELLIFDRLL